NRLGSRLTPADTAHEGAGSHRLGDRDRSRVTPAGGWAFRCRRPSAPAGGRSAGLLRAGTLTNAPALNKEESRSFAPPGSARPSPSRNSSDALPGGPALSESPCAPTRSRLAGCRSPSLATRRAVLCDSVSLWFSVRR